MEEGRTRGEALFPGLYPFSPSGGLLRGPARFRGFVRTIGRKPARHKGFKAAELERVNGFVPSTLTLASCSAPVPRRRNPETSRWLQRRQREPEAPDPQPDLRALRQDLLVQPSLSSRGGCGRVETHEWPVGRCHCVLLCKFSRGDMWSSQSARPTRSSATPASTSSATSSR